MECTTGGTCPEGYLPDETNTKCEENTLGVTNGDTGKNHIRLDIFLTVALWAVMVRNRRLHLFGWVSVRSEQ